MLRHCGVAPYKNIWGKKTHKKTLFRGKAGGGGGGVKKMVKQQQQQKLCALHRKEKVCIDEHHLSKHISPHQNYQKSVEHFCWINYISNLEPNCQYSCSSCSSSSQDCSQIFASPSKYLQASQNICLCFS